MQCHLECRKAPLTVSDFSNQQIGFGEKLRSVGRKEERNTGAC